MFPGCHVVSGKAHEAIDSNVIRKKYASQDKTKNFDFLPADESFDEEAAASADVDDSEEGNDDENKNDNYIGNDNSEDRHDGENDNDNNNSLAGIGREKLVVKVRASGPHA